VDGRGVNLSASIELRLRPVPGRMRFILQPTVATIPEVRDGVKDARAASAPFLFGLAFHPTARTGLLLSALASVHDLVAVAIFLDLVAQFSCSEWFIRGPHCCWAF
jgi:hypothetical protein